MKCTIYLNVVYIFQTVRYLVNCDETIVWQGELSDDFKKDVEATFKRMAIYENTRMDFTFKFLQWISKGFMKNLNSFEKRQVVWTV